MIDAGFRPGGRACCLARPEGRNLCCGAKGPNNGRTLRDAPCKVTPRPASPDWADAGYREGESTRCAHTRLCRFVRASARRAGGRHRSGGKGGFESSPVTFQHVLGCCGHSLVSRPRTMVCHPSKKILEIIWNDSIREKFTPDTFVWSQNKPKIQSKDFQP